jgi:ribose 5-phosphate isomerase RpiB
VNDPYTARLSRAHNDGRRIVATGLADAVASTAFEGGRYQRRMLRIAEIEEQHDEH